MKLLGSTYSPYVRKVRVVMAEKKLDYTFVVDDVWADGTQITDSNPLGKIPCLVMEGAETLFDSRVIVEYLDTLSPVGKLIPAVGRERAEIKTWEALADGLLDAAILARLEATWEGRTKAQRSQLWMISAAGDVQIMDPVGWGFAAPIVPVAACGITGPFTGLAFDINTPN